MKGFRLCIRARGAVTEKMGEIGGVVRIDLDFFRLCKGGATTRGFIGRAL